MIEPLPQTFIVASDYISLDRCAAAYRELVAELGCLAPNLDEAEVVILQLDLGKVAPMLTGLPALRHKKVVGFLVWETDRLPAEATLGLERFDAIWTPSWFSAKSLVPHHPNVLWLPHVVPPAAAADAAAVAALRDQLQMGGTCVLLQILASAFDPRKGGRETEAAFLDAVRLRPGLRLITKQLHRPVPPFEVADALKVTHRGPITTLSGHLPAPQMAALYGCCDYVVNGAHAEGWGLTLSDAMAAGIPTIAADYSGQLAYLHRAAALLVPTQEDEVRPEHQSSNFRPPMRWGYMLPHQLTQAMVRAHDLLPSDAYAHMAAVGRRHVRAYDGRHVKVMLRNLLRRLVARPAPPNV